MPTGSFITSFQELYTLIFLLTFLWWIIKKTCVGLVAVFSDDEGAVQITPQALRELVRRSCATIPGVHSPTTTIFIKNKKPGY